MSVAQGAYNGVPQALDELQAELADHRLAPVEADLLCAGLSTTEEAQRNSGDNVADSAARPLDAVLPRQSGADDEALAHLSMAAPRAGARLQRTLRLAAVDLVGCLLSMVIGHAVLSYVGPAAVSQDIGRGYYIAAPAFLLALALHGNYRERWQRLQPSPVRIFWSMAQAFATSVLILAGSDSLLAGDGGRDIHLTEATAILAPTLITVPLLRLIAANTVLRNHRSQCRILVLGSGRVARSLAERIRRTPGIAFVGLVDDAPADPMDVIGSVSVLPDIVERQQVDRVFVAFSRVPQQETLLTLRALKGRVGISVVPRMYELLSWRATIEELHGIPLLHVAPQQMSLGARTAKRGLDFVVAGGLLLLFAPVLAAISVAIRLTSPGPALFRQERTGRNRRPFQIYKFRTMVADADAQKAQLAELNESDGPIFKMRQDPRVTPLGAFLRRTSIDEFPQLINVIRGEMSLVGPRPFPPAEAARIGGWASTRFSVLPGITGLWQVSGRSELSNEDLLHLDSVYVSSWSLGWDLRILLRTPRTVLRRVGAF